MFFLHFFDLRAPALLTISMPTIVAFHVATVIDVRKTGEALVTIPGHSKLFTFFD